MLGEFSYFVKIIKKMKKNYEKRYNCNIRR